MGNHYQILLPLLSLFFCRVDLTDLIPLRYEVEIKEILDGDTLVVKKGSYTWKVRLSKIDAPELGQAFLSGGDAGKKSTECLRRTLKKHHLILEIEHFDMYRRILGDMGELTLDLVESGCAPLYPYSRFKSRKEKGVFLRALKKARHLRKGLWAHGGFRRPNLWRKTSKRSAVRR